MSLVQPLQHEEGKLGCSHRHAGDHCRPAHCECAHASHVSDFETVHKASSPGMQERPHGHDVHMHQPADHKTNQTSNSRNIPSCDLKVSIQGHLEHTFMSGVYRHSLLWR